MQTVTIAHPLEQVFDLETNSTPVSVITPVEIPTSPPAPNYDAKDEAIDTELAQVQAEAMAIVADLKSQLQFSSDPRGAPRMGEVMIQALNTALDAVKQKADIKKHKDKLVATANTDSTSNVTNNTLIIDRSALLDKIIAGEI